MKLAHGWSASFLDSSQRIVLAKPGRSGRVCLEWQKPFLRAIDPASGVLLTGLQVWLPEDVRQPLLKAARERWN